MRDHAIAAVAPGREALLIACTDFPTLPLIAELERTLGIPVVTSNQATLWAMLRAQKGLNGRDGGRFYEKALPLKAFVRDESTATFPEGLVPREDELIVSKQ